MSCSNCNTPRCSCPTIQPPGAIADYVIVGLGTAGCALARYLTEDMTTSVIVLEAGINQENQPNIKTSNPNVIPSVPSDPRWNQPYLVDTSNVRLPFVFPFPLTAGRMWGGSSGHYVFGAVRGAPKQYNQWGLVNSRWSYDNLLPFMLFLETFNPNVSTTPNPNQRGSSGSLDVSQTAPIGADKSAFLAALESVLSTPFVNDYNDPENVLAPAAPDGSHVVGYGPTQQYLNAALTQRAWSMTAFLTSDVITEDAEGNGHGVGDRKLEVISRATAVKVLLDDGETPTARGVRYFLGTDPGKMREVFARKKVIVCCGTIGTAQLLQLSGIGPTSVLEAAGVEVRVANENVGRNVQEHYGVEVLIAEDPESPTLGGPTTLCHWDGSNAVNPNGQANDNERRMNIALFWDSTRVLPAYVPIALNLTGTQMIGVLGRLWADTNKLGTIEISNRDPLTLPTVKLGYYQDTAAPGEKSDLDRIVDFYLAAADIALAYTGDMPVYPPAAHYPNTYPGGAQVNDARLRQDALDDFLNCYFVADHAAGSCRMATSAADGVVDGDLNVFGVNNLGIADNSIIPETPTSNTAWQAFIIGLVKAKIEGATGLP